MTKLIWSDEAEKNLIEIYEFIAFDSEPRAREFVRKLKTKARRLKRFPYSGRIVPELAEQPGQPREILVQNYRIIYDIHHGGIKIVMVRHGMRLL